MNVYGEQTTFPTDAKTSVYVEGLARSGTVGAETIDLELTGG